MTTPKSEKFNSWLNVVLKLTAITTLVIMAWSMIGIRSDLSYTVTVLFDISSELEDISSELEDISSELEGTGFSLEMIEEFGLKDY